MSASFVAEGDPAELVVPPMVPSAEERLHAESMAEWQPEATAAERAIEAAYRDGVTASVQAVIAALREPSDECLNAMVEQADAHKLAHNTRLVERIERSLSPSAMPSEHRKPVDTTDKT